MEKYELKIASRPESIATIEKLIDQIKEQYNINEECYGNILVAITEAVNNAIIHGNKLDTSKEVTLCYEAKDGEISFTITDQGSGFDYYNLPDPTAPENLEKANGRGVFLMKHLSDRIIFSEDGKIVELFFNIN